MSGILTRESQLQTWRFDGASGLTGSDVTVDPAAGFSFQIIVRPATAHVGYFISLHDSSQVGVCWRYGSSGFPEIALREQLAGGPQSIKAIPDALPGKWSALGGSVSAVGTAADFKTYYNGMDLGSTALTLRDALQSTIQVRIGHAASLGNPLNAWVAEVVIFNSVLTPAQFNDLFETGGRHLPASVWATCIGLYKFNESRDTETGAFVLDSSGRNNHLTPSSGAQKYGWDRCSEYPKSRGILFPYCFRLNGSNQFGTTGTTASIRSEATGVDQAEVLTCCSWVKHKGGDGGKWNGIHENGGEIAGVDYATGNMRCVGKSLNGDTVQLCGEDIAIQSIEWKAANTGGYKGWGFLVGVNDYKNKRQKLYWNGICVGQRTGVSGFTQDRYTGVSTTEFTIGARVAGTSLVNGWLGPQWLYRRELTQEEILKMYRLITAPRNGLVAEYLLLEGSGTTLVDSSGNGNNSNLQNSPPWQIMSGF